MSRGQRLGLIAAAAAVAVAAFIVLRPDDDEKREPEPAPAAQTPSAEPGEQKKKEKPKKPAQPEATVIEVADGEPKGGVETIKVDKGERVRLEVRSSDTAEEVHVHGYDLLRDMAPGKPAKFSFEADIEGIFEVELEGVHEQLAELRVEP